LNQEAVVSIKEGTTDPIPIRKVVRQGCLLSPALFNAYSERMMEQALSGNNKGIWINGERINTIKFADDQAIIAGSARALQTMLNKIQETTKRFGMKINIGKTKTMVIEKDKRKLEIEIGGKKIEKVQWFKYLGQIITEDARNEREVRARIAMAKKAFRDKQRMLASKNVDVNTRKRIIRCYIWSIALYGAETWTLNKREESSLEAFEMWCYRKMEKVSWTERKTNEEVLMRVGEERKIKKIIRQRRLRWLGHILRHEGTTGRILEGRIQGKRGRGRPRNTFTSQACRDVSVKKYSEMKRMAWDRGLWRDKIHLL